MKIDALYNVTARIKHSSNVLCINSRSEMRIAKATAIIRMLNNTLYKLSNTQHKFDLPEKDL